MEIDQQISQLKQEIESYQVELCKLQAELNQLTASSAYPNSNSPTDIAQAVRAAAAEAPARQVEVQGLRNAIAELNGRLKAKQASLVDLERQQLHQRRLARLEQGKQRIRDKGRELEQAVQIMQSVCLDLTLLNQEYREDFAALHPTSSSAYQILGIDGPVTFEPILLPRLAELEGKRFHLGSTTFDPCAAEKLRQREEECRKFARLQAQAGEQARAMQQQRQREQQQRDRERLTSLLEQKKLERAHLLDQKSIWGSSMNVDRLTAKIEALDTEITEMQSQINALTDEAAV